MKTTIEFKGATKDLDDFDYFDPAENKDIRQDHFLRTTERIEVYTYRNFEYTQDLSPIFLTKTYPSVQPPKKPMTKLKDVSKLSPQDKSEYETMVAV